MDLIQKWKLKVKSRMTPRLRSLGDRELKCPLISKRQPPTFGRHASGATTMSCLAAVKEGQFFTVGQRNLCVNGLLLM